MPWGYVVGAVIGGMMASSSASSNRRSQERQSEQALAFQKEQAALLEKQKEVYRNMEFKNPYANMENPFEDLTVNQQQARFLSQQSAQARADILSQLRGAAGGAGIGGLAQALANKGAIQAQKISATIGLQEAQNRQLRAKGAAAADMAERGGEQLLQTMEADRQATLLGMQQGMTAGANAALQQQYSNQMMSNMYGTAQTNQAWINAFKELGNVDWGGDNTIYQGGTLPEVTVTG